MRVLWFEVTVPSSYVNGGTPIGGWQDSLERVMRTIPEVELIIAFVSEEATEVKAVAALCPVLDKARLLEDSLLDTSLDSIISCIILI